MQFRIEKDIPQNNYCIQVQSTENFSLAAIDTDIRDMLERVSRSLEVNLARIYESGLNTELWGGNYSLRNTPDYIQCFEPLTGSIKISGEIENRSIAGFYDEEERSYIRGGQREVRAKSYYIAVDPEYITSIQKLSIITRDVLDIKKIIEEVRGSELRGNDYLGYLGLLDYLKQHSLTIFHVLTYPERYGINGTDSQYSKFREIALELAKRNTVRFYRTCLGYSLDGWELSQDIIQLLEVIKYLEGLERDYKQYTLQEVDHPLRLLLHANQLINQYPDTDTIVPILSGGTQSGIIVQEGFRMLGKESTQLITLPYSTHSAKINFGRVLSSEDLTRIFEQYMDFIVDRNILVTEDNSNSGQTAQLISDLLHSQQARSVHFGFVEIDPHRIMYKQSSQRNEKGEFIANYLHPDFSTTTGVLPVARYLKKDYQLRKMYVWRLFNSYKKDV